jgi:hypothetical protein
MTPLLHAQAAPAVKAALAKEAGTLSDKFAGLARMMAGKYDSKPGPGGRSVSDVFNLIVMENSLLAGTLTGAGGRGGAQPAPVTDPEKMQEALKNFLRESAENGRGAVGRRSQCAGKAFRHRDDEGGRDQFLFGDQHEHLGQSIVYARSNGVTPPWSKWKISTLRQRMIDDMTVRILSMANW